MTCVSSIRKANGHILREHNAARGHLLPTISSFEKYFVRRACGSFSPPEFSAAACSKKVRVMCQVWGGKSQRRVSRAFQLSVWRPARKAGEGGEGKELNQN